MDGVMAVAYHATVFVCLTSGHYLKNIENKYFRLAITRAQIIHNDWGANGRRAYWWQCSNKLSSFEERMQEDSTSRCVNKLFWLQPKYRGFPGTWWTPSIRPCESSWVLHTNWERVARPRSINQILRGFTGNRAAQPRERPLLMSWLHKERHGAEPLRHSLQWKWSGCNNDLR